MGVAVILEDAQKLTPGNLVTLYEIDCTGIGGAIERYHNHNDGKIVWQGNFYEPWAIEGKNFERTGDSQQRNPTLQVGNIGADEQGEPIAGVVSASCKLVWVVVDQWARGRLPWRVLWLYRCGYV